MTALIWAGATLLWVGLFFLEWRRVDRAHRVARLGAITLAVAALAWLGFARLETGKKSGSIEAVLWTAQSGGERETTSGNVLRFALPDAQSAPADAVVVPDLAYLRRTWPEIAALEVRGDGLSADDAGRLTGVRVKFKAPMESQGFVAVDAPAQIALGEKLRVRGRLNGIRAGKSVVVTLEGPDGALLVTTLVAGPSGAVDFDIAAPSAPAMGRFVWKLRATENAAPDRVLAQEALGVAVVAPTLPRVLVLESSPRLDTARLRSWFAEKGGRLVSRTSISRDRYRFGSSGGVVDEFGALDEKLLASYDVVLTDGATLMAMSEAERKILQEAASGRGVGVGLLADDALLVAAQGGAGVNNNKFFLPWQVTAVGEGDATDNGRRVRLQGSPDAALPAEPVAVAAFEINGGANQVAWLRDSQARTVTGAVRRGRGWVAMSLVRDTWRWRQGERPAAFAEYWSWWLQALAPADAKGRWSLATTWPRVDEPVRLHWSGSGGRPASGVVKANDDGFGSSLALAQDRLEPSRWEGTFWPRRAGWHHVASPDGAALDFLVNATDAWSGVRAQEKRDVTARVAAASRLEAEGVANLQAGARVPTGLLLAAFVASAGYLWFEARQRRRS